MEIKWKKQDGEGFYSLYTKIANIRKKKNKLFKGVEIKKVTLNLSKEEKENIIREKETKGRFIRKK